MEWVDRRNLLQIDMGERERWELNLLICIIVQLLQGLSIDMINKRLKNNEFSKFTQMYGEEKKQEGDVGK